MRTLFSLQADDLGELEKVYKIQLSTNGRGMLLRVALSPSQSEAAVPKPCAFLLQPIIKIRSSNDAEVGVVHERGH